MRFEFATATRIIFGAGALREIAPTMKNFGSRALVVTGGNVLRAEPLLGRLSSARIETVLFRITGEPTIDLVQSGVQLARVERCQFVIGFGGGSVIDAGKAIAALLTNPGNLLDYLEVVGQAKPLLEPSLPCVAVPTTAGTGAEVTRNAVLALPEHRVKVSLRSPLMLPRLAVVDPELTYELPPALTASTGLDALTQLIEPFVSVRANPMTDSICREGMIRAARSLRRAYEDGTCIAAREDMALASLLGGLALANAGLGAVHGFAGPVGGMFPAPHGAVCAALLPHVMEINLRALRQRAPAGHTLPRYDEVARILTGNRDATADAGLDWLRELCAALKVLPLRTYGITASDLPTVCEKAAASSSLKGNPVMLSNGEMQEILEKAL